MKKIIIINRIIAIIAIAAIALMVAVYWDGNTIGEKMLGVFMYAIMIIGIIGSINNAIKDKED